VFGVAWSYYPVSTLPAPLDVVLCKFPEDLDLQKPPLKTRPGLVIKTAYSDPGFEPEVRVVYGTSNLKMSKRRYDLIVMNNQEMYEAGLSRATRFDLDKIVWMPWCSEFFIKPDHPHYSSPVIGHLSDNSTRLLGHLMAERQRRQRPDDDD
jgi:hypothetical protein